MQQKNQNQQQHYIIQETMNSQNMQLNLQQSSVNEPIQSSNLASSEAKLKRPLQKTSPYGFFVKMCYEEYRNKYPNEAVQINEISKKCSQTWKTLSEDKKKFFEFAQKEAERCQMEATSTAVSIVNGESSKKRKRAKKDPNAPKRALSAFFYFSNDKRPEVQKNHPEWKVGQIAQELGRIWKEIKEQDKQIYEQRALVDKKRYTEEMTSYQGGSGKKSAAKKEENVEQKNSNLST